jgi:hypothetical protein
MNSKKIAFIVSIIVAMITATIGFFALADLIQWVIHFPDNFTFWTFNNRGWLMAFGLLGFITAIFLNYKKMYIKKWVLAGFILNFLIFFMGGFIAPSYLMFRSEHYQAEYLNIEEVFPEYLLPEDEVLVMDINGDARAYPHKWIVQPHIAGGIVGGEDVVMTYCGLSHVGQAYKSAVDGEPINLKVMTQLKNNLVMYDGESKEPIPQIYGCMVNTDRNLEALGSTAMSYASFKRLYPDGKVYYYTHSNFMDKLVYKMLDHAIYRPGGQYDMATEKLSFPSISHEDNRLHAKEKVYGIHHNGRSVAYTKDYLIKNKGAVTETFGNDTVTIKYFTDYDFVNVYYGNVPEIDSLGKLNGESVEEVPHFNLILWKVWANFYKDTEVRI